MFWETVMLQYVTRRNDYVTGHVMRDGYVTVCYTKERLCYSSCYEKDLKNHQNRLADLERQRECALREVAELKVQLQMVEETRDTLRRELIDAKHQIREGNMTSLYSDEVIAQW